MLRVHLHVYVNVGKLKSTLIVSLSQYYKPCNILPDLYTTSCVTAVLAIFSVECGRSWVHAQVRSNQGLNNWYKLLLC